MKETGQIFETLGNGKETAEDILERHRVKVFGAMKDRMTEAIREIADKALKNGLQIAKECTLFDEDYNHTLEKKLSEDFMKELFNT